MNDPLSPHWSKLFRYFMRHTGNVSLSEDLTQDTMLRAVRSRKAFVDDPVGARRYLFAIGANLLKDHYRETARYHTSPLHDFIPGRMDVEREVAARAEWETVRAILPMLTINEEAVLLLAANQFTYQEAAAAMKVPAGTHTSRLWRARQRLIHEVNAPQ